jgi:hypothetical protein
MAAGLHIVTPNKRAGSGPYGRWQVLQGLRREAGRRWLYEATVGAGLPVINTLHELQRTGDRVARVEGVFSGTLSYVFNRLGEGAKLSEAVSEAKARGYTEPDPRDDLSGTDVARKLVIVAREMGLVLELDDVVIEPLVSPALAAVEGVEAFMAALPATTRRWRPVAPRPRRRARCCATWAWWRPAAGRGWSSRVPRDARVCAARGDATTSSRLRRRGTARGRSSCRAPARAPR